MLLFFLFLFLSSASSLCAMELLPNRSENTQFEALQFEGSTEKDILSMVESLMLKELTEPVRRAAPSHNLPLEQMLKNHVTSQCNPQSRTRLCRIFRLIKSPAIMPLFIQANDNIILPDALADLDVIIGTSNLNHSIARRVKKTFTHIGYITLCRHLVQIKSHENLVKMQTCVIKLKNEQLLNEVQLLLSELATIEDTFISFWVDTDFGVRDPLVENAEKQKFKRVYFNDLANDSVIATEIGQISNFVLPYVPLAVSCGTALAGAFTANPIMAVFGMAGAAFKLSSITQDIEIAKSLAMTLLLMQGKLKAVRIFIEKIEQLRILLINNNLPEQVTDPLLLATTSTQVARLIELLKKDTFKDEPSFWSNWGRIHVTFNLMMKQRDYFLNAYRALGSIDFLASIAKLTSDATPQTPFCQAEYIPSNTLPEISIDNGWSVLTLADPISIVTNNIHLGNRQPRCIIITGPNARGKTTILRTTAGAALLSCTLGFASADKICIPQNLSFITSINIKDDPAKNLSLFQAGAKRIADLCRTVVSHPEITWLIILDEPFTGTNRDIAEASACEFISLLGHYPNALMLVTSHLATVTHLESHHANIFANFHVRTGYQYTRGTDISEDYNEVAVGEIRKAMPDEEFIARIRATIKATNTLPTISAAAAAAAPAATSLRTPVNPSTAKQSSLNHGT